MTEPRGCAGLFVGHPFVKVRLQSQTQTTMRYSGTWNCLVNIVRKEKVQGLFKGMAGVAAVNAVIFSVYETSLTLQTQATGTDPTLGQVFAAGLVTGVVSSIITCPMELAKIRLQNQIPADQGIMAGKGATAPLKGPLDCFMRTFRQGGMRACYRGFTPTILRELSLGPYFVSYELYCRWLKPVDRDIDDLGPMSLILAGGFAGITAWLTTYPMDVIKTRMQDIDPQAVKKSPYRTMLGTACACYQEGGARVFFRGLNATIIRAFPCNAATFFVYATAIRFMNRESYSTASTPLPETE
ncbi:mitochondrial carrier domain-containing protein [Dimargaris cristalligena]|uniref:Mitochondrial carrier domain-containing protein n=1 Tax=Dimargaris cristalligena TaxID=215637 RepID=A0A4Q0A1Q9_9FUNG|nr:mitochondrial carrier domain-containing protein [Dimargaris cristalligena]|eukprot:RKP39232.1 mitochondrial carrier domain-containing protein [Dimargaris cristalligena]